MHAHTDPRIRRRIPCSLEVQGLRQKALVLNLSRTGLFVQTNTRVKRGTEVAVSLDVGKPPESLALPARVVWARGGASRNLGTDEGGLGLRLGSTPLGYLAMCDELLPVLKSAVGSQVGARPDRSAKPAVEAAPVIPLHPYRVRLKLAGSARTRWVEVEAVTREAASREALALAAPGTPRGAVWEVLEVRAGRPA